MPDSRSWLVLDGVAFQSWETLFELYSCEMHWYALNICIATRCQKWIWHSFVFVTTPIGSFVQELALPKACHDTKVYGWKRRRMELDWWLISTASLCLSCVCVCVCLCDCSMLSLWQHVCFPRLTSERADDTVALRYLYANVKGGDGGSHRYDCWMICWMISSRCHTLQSDKAKVTNIERSLQPWWSSMSKSSHPKPDTLFFLVGNKDAQFECRWSQGIQFSRSCRTTLLWWMLHGVEQWKALGTRRKGTRL